MKLSFTNSSFGLILSLINVHLKIDQFTTNCASPAWWPQRGAPTRSHPELGRETPQRQWYCILRCGRVGRCQACKTQFEISSTCRRSRAYSPSGCAPRGRPDRPAATWPCLRCAPDLKSHISAVFRSNRNYGHAPDGAASRLPAGESRGQTKQKCKGWPKTYRGYIGTLCPKQITRDGAAR